MNVRRRGNKADADGGNILHLPAPTRRRRPPSGAPPRRSGCNVGFACLLVALFSALVLVEFMAYQKLGKAAEPLSSPAASVIDGAAATNKNPSPKQNAQPPTKHPTKVNVGTFEPTEKPKGWRLRAALKATNDKIQFWKSHDPDPVPPLPPDKDPETGAELPPVIAYVTTLTKCGPKHRGGLDGAAVLLHSIRRNSWGWVPIEKQVKKAGNSVITTEVMRPQYGGKGGRYRYRAYVIVDPQASPGNHGRSGECARFLQKIGYTVLHRPPIVPLFELTDDGGGHYAELKKQGYVGMQRPKDGPTAPRPGEGPNKLRMMMYNDGCCGYTEMLKLHVYGLVEHKLAVHLDFDSLLLRPMDDLFDTMLGKNHEEARKQLPLAKLPHTKDVDLTRPIDAAFTRDYNSVVTPKPDSPVGYQGGFLVVKPSLEVLERYRTILRKGEFMLNPRTGWEGKHGGFYGDVTFQGILPYYYEHVAPEGEHNEAELDRCVFNQMGDNPRKSTYKFPRATPLEPEKMGFRDTKVCRDGRKDCSDTDCQRIHPKDSITTHFTFCKKPWDCSEGNPGTVVHDTCIGLLNEWYSIRRELEDWWMLPAAEATAAKSDSLNNQQSFYWKDQTISKVRKAQGGAYKQYLGYCEALGPDAEYHRMVEPDGPKA